MSLQTFDSPVMRVHDRGDMPLENHYTVSEAARILGVGKGAIHKAIQKGQLEAKSIGNMMFIHKDELARYKSQKRGRGRPREKRSYTRKTED